MGGYVSKYQRKEQRKNKNLTTIFCILMVASLFLGQIGKESFAYANIVGWTFGIIFCILATITSIRAKATKKKKKK